MCSTLNSHHKYSRVLNSFFLKYQLKPFSLLDGVSQLDVLNRPNQWLSNLHKPEKCKDIYRVKDIKSGKYF